MSNVTCNQNCMSYHSFLGLKFLKNVTMPWCNSSRKLDSLKIMNILQGRKNKELSRRSLCSHFCRWKCALHFRIVNWFVWTCVIVLSNLAVYLWSFVHWAWHMRLKRTKPDWVARRPIPTQSTCTHDCQGGFIKDNKKASDWSIQVQA